MNKLFRKTDEKLNTYFTQHPAADRLFGFIFNPQRAAYWIAMAIILAAILACEAISIHLTGHILPLPTFNQN